MNLYQSIQAALLIECKKLSEMDSMNVGATSVAHIQGFLNI